MEKFVSYAQNCEDVVLWRALKHVSHGRYIDVGANHPVYDSVTKAFYDRGWRGINIEPVRSLYEQLVQQRPDDINLCCAISSEEGQAQFFEIADAPGLSTMERSQADRHAQAGHTILDYPVPVKTLTSVCLAQGVKEVHFVKIDVEGAELAVLEGSIFEILRPWIIVIEATLPNTQVPSHLEWEHLLLSAGYSCTYFDGLNRFYLSSDHPELRSAFAAPPNSFDNFIHYATYGQLMDELESTRITAEKYRTHIAEMKRSASWRLTKPLRALQYVTRTAVRMLGGRDR